MVFHHTACIFLKKEPVFLFFMTGNLPVAVLCLRFIKKKKHNVRRIEERNGANMKDIIV